MQWEMQCDLHGLQFKLNFFSQFFACSAGTVLNLAFVQEHLASFIKEKENLQEALHAK